MFQQRIEHLPFQIHLNATFDFASQIAFDFFAQLDHIAIGHARRLIRKISMADAERIAAQALQASNAKEALRYSTDYLERNMPEILAAVREG